MSRLEEQIEISVPRVDVFKYCHDLSRWTAWDEQVTHVELLSPKPIRRGTLLRMDANIGSGSVFSWDCEIAEYQMPQGSKVRLLDVASSSPIAKGSEISLELNTIGNGTQVILTWNYKPHGIIATILDRLGRRAALRRGIRRSLDNLKSQLESGQRATIT